ncbi:MAG: response regulator transcription factor [Terriglobales bacterium]
MSAPVRVALELPAGLWNQLLAQALVTSTGASTAGPALDPRLGATAAFEPLPRRPAVLLTTLPADRAGAERLRHWCQRGEVDGQVRVLVLGDNRPGMAMRALRLGAAGYLDWQSPLPVLEKAIRRVHAGEIWAERRVVFGLTSAAPGRASRLTPQELHVLECLAEGKRNKEIADLLAIRETTVKSHLNRAYRKLHLNDRLQAALYVERIGLEAVS